jgi:hypothetical protein
VIGEAGVVALRVSVLEDNVWGCVRHSVVVRVCSSTVVRKYAEPVRTRCGWRAPARPSAVADVMDSHKPKFGQPSVYVLETGVALGGKCRRTAWVSGRISSRYTRPQRNRAYCAPL